MFLSQIAKYQGICIIYNNVEYTFTQLRDKVNDYKSKLADDIKQRDTVSIEGDYSFDSIALLLALIELKCSIVPLVKASDTNQKVKVANVTVKIKNGQPIRLKESDNSNTPTLILFTSGTTGEPQLITNNLGELLSRYKIYNKPGGRRLLQFLMFDHMGGIHTWLSALSKGDTLILTDNRQPAHILELVKRHNIEVLPVTPTYLNMLLQLGDREALSSVKLITYGAERMPESLLVKLNTELSQISFKQTYGTSEFGVIKTESKSNASLYFKITDEYVKHEVREGELWLGIGGKWKPTGDLVTVDGESYIKIEGRKDDMINVGGHKVLPVEVEKVINTIDGVLDSTVHGEGNAIMGQIVAAKVFADVKTDVDALKKKVRKICTEKLPPHKIPVRISIENKLELTDRLKKQM